MSKSTKPTKPALRPVVNNLTEEEKELQVARYLANEKKTYFQLILANLVQNPAFVRFTQGFNVSGEINLDISVRAAVVAAVRGADIAVEELYPVDKKED